MWHLIRFFETETYIAFEHHISNSVITVEEVKTIHFLRWEEMWTVWQSYSKVTVQRPQSESRHHTVRFSIPHASTPNKPEPPHLEDELKTACSPFSLKCHSVAQSLSCCAVDNSALLLFTFTQALWRRSLQQDQENHTKFFFKLFSCLKKIQF